MRGPPIEQPPAHDTEPPIPPVDAVTNLTRMKQFIIAGHVIFAKSLSEAYAYYREFCKAN